MGEKEYRTRAQVMIDDCLSIDFPPDAYYHSLKFGVNYSKLKYILATHSHMDHFYAHDFILRGYKFAYSFEPCLEIYGNEEVKKVFDECTARELKEEVKANLKVDVLKPYEVINVGQYKVITLPANHSKAEEALLYYVESAGKGYLHFYDTAQLEDEVFAFLKNNGVHVNLVCFDCTFVERTGGKTARHMGIPDNMLMKQKLADYGIIDDKTKIVISHFSHNGCPTREKLKEIEKQYGVIAAFDGLIINM
ncbi:MAG: hypothetical protein K2N23_00850 [Clostridia bacterium]|nr:hypothetical protein [Clostridia bacterium]